MPLPLDMLLFWVGLGITLVGLVVFLMGRVLPDKEKKGANKFGSIRVSPRFFYCNNSRLCL